MTMKVILQRRCTIAVVLATLFVFTIIIMGREKQVGVSSKSERSCDKSAHSMVESAIDTADPNMNIDSSTGRVFQGLKIRSFQTMTSSLKRNSRDNRDDIVTPSNDSLPFSPKFIGKCSKWGVVTTIFNPTEAIKRMASLPLWCLVIVPDTKTPLDYMIKLKQIYTSDSKDGAALDNIFFFSIDSQKKWEEIGGPLGSFARATPWKHFCRKNLGYLFAILHGAKYIFDFDDDNIIKEDSSGKPMHILSSEKVLRNVTVISSSHVAFNHHPIMKPTMNEISWARGFPLEYIKDASTRGVRVPSHEAHGDISLLSATHGDIAVLQFLADDNPDIDALHRLSKPLPLRFQFEKATSILAPEESYSPYNAQATIHTANALWATLLPATVPGRVSDIWRSYFAQCIFKDSRLRVVFLPPTILQIRNEHNILGDLSAEQDLYLKSGKLIQYLSTRKMGHARSIPERMEQLWIDLYERGYIELDDVLSVHVWLKSLKQIGYQFPPMRGEKRLGREARGNSSVTPRLSVRISEQNEESKGVKETKIHSDFDKIDIVDQGGTLNSDKKFGVVGILSSSTENSVQYRLAQRRTWAQDARHYSIKVYFLLDQPTNSLDAENEEFKDILYINATHTGRAVRFGEKLHLWLSLARALHPTAAFVAKVDDDCVVCSNVMWPFVWTHVEPTTYLGWMHDFKSYTLLKERDVKRVRDQRLDEFFVVLGMALVERLTDSVYCMENNEAICSAKNELFDTNYGGTSLGIWLENYDDIKIVTLNEISGGFKLSTCQGTLPYVHPVKNSFAFVEVYNQSS